MKYMLMVFEDEQVYGPNKENAAFEAIGRRHFAFHDGLGSAWLAGAALKAATVATTVRTSGDKQTIHDGPYAESKEQLGGFYIIEVPDLDAAIEAAKKLPLHRDGAVEIRPVLHLGGS